MSSGTPAVTEGAGAADEAAKQKDLRDLARGSSLNLAGTVVNALMNLALPIIVTRNLTNTQAGYFFEATALFMILINVGCLGADTGLLRDIPRARELGRHRELKGLLAVATVPSVVLSVVISTLLLIFGGPLSRLGVKSPDSDPSLLHTEITILAPLLVIAVVYTILVSATRGFGPIKPLVVVEKIGRNGAQTGVVWLSQLLTASATLLIVAWVLPYVAAFVVIVLWIYRIYRKAMRAATVDSAPARPVSVISKEFWAFSGPRAASRIFNVALQRLDILLVGAISGPRDAAVYAAASRFLTVGLMFVQAIQQVMAPNLAGMLARGDHERALAMYRTTTAWLTAVSWPMYLISAVYASLLLRVFGSGYERGAPVVIILCLSMLVGTSCGPVDVVLLMGGRSTVSLMNTGLALAVNVGLDLLLIPRYGIVGAALGWTAAIFLNNLLPLWQVNRLLSMHPFGPATQRVMLTAALSTGVLTLIVRLLLGQNLLSLAVALVLAGLAYLGLLWRQREITELDDLAAALRRRPARSRGRHGTS